MKKDTRCKEQRVGPTFRGQHWITLHGTFTREELVVILAEVTKNSTGLEQRKHGQG
jgi:hypothetical protein